MKIPASIYNPVSLDGGRILAATAIFYFHAGLFTHYPLSKYGEFAVEYFVMLSGISYALFSSLKPASSSEYFQYVKRRLAALFPMYLLVNLGLYLVSFVYPSTLGRPYGFGEFLASATGTSLYLGWHYMSTVMWFMPFIVQVYLLIPLLDWWAGRTHPVVLMLAAFCLSCLLAQCVPFFQDDPAGRLVCKNWSPVFRLPEVCAGIIMGRAALMTSRGGGGAMLALATFGLLSLAVSLLAETHVPLRIYLPWGGFLIPMLLLVCPVLISPLLRVAGVKFLRLLGLSSFSFYLFQAAPMHAVCHRFGAVVLVWVCYYLACWLVAVGLTWLITRFKSSLTILSRHSPAGGKMR